MGMERIITFDETGVSGDGMGTVSEPTIEPSKEAPADELDERAGDDSEGLPEPEPEDIEDDTPPGPISP